MQQRTIRAGANTAKANEGGKRGEEQGPVFALDRFVDDVNHFEGVLGVELALAPVMIVALLILFLHLAPQTDLFLFLPGVLLLGTKKRLLIVNVSMTLCQSWKLGLMV